MYIDAGAYSSSLKQKLVAGSPMPMVEHRCNFLLPRSASTQAFTVLCCVWWRSRLC